MSKNMIAAKETDSKPKTILSINKCLKMGGKFARNILQKWSLNKQVDDDKLKISYKTSEYNSHFSIHTTQMNFSHYDLLDSSSSPFCCCQSNMNVLLEKCENHDSDFSISSIFDLNDRYFIEDYTCEFLVANYDNLNSTEMDSYSNEEEDEQNSFVSSFENSSQTSISSPVCTSTSFSSLDSSESSLGSLLDNIESTKISNSTNPCCCINLSSHYEIEKNENNGILVDNEELEKIKYEINECKAVIENLKFAKNTQENDPASLRRLFTCISEYSAQFDGDLSVKFADPVYLLGNFGSDSEWLSVQSVETGQIGTIPRYVTVELDLFLNKLERYYTRLIDQIKKRKNH
jgi:hypothetical protein